MPLLPLDFLMEASARSLQDCELASRNRSANLSKIIRRELEAWIEQEAAAMLAQWIRENREAIIRYAATTVEMEPKKIDFLKRDERKSA